MAGCSTPGARREASTPPSRSRHREAREAEVGDARAAVAADQHVVRLEVAMDEPGFVRGGEPARGVDEDARASRATARGVAASHSRSVRPVDVLHRDQTLAAEPTDIVDRDHVRMREARHRLRLARARRASRAPSRRRRAAADAP